MDGKLAPNSTPFTRRLVEDVPGRDYCRAIPSQNGDKFVTSPPAPPSPPIVEPLYLLEERVTYSNKQYPFATRHNAAHVGGHEPVKNPSIGKIHLN